MNARRTPPDLGDIFFALGELTSSVKAIEGRQAEEVANSKAHRQRVYERLDAIEGTLEKNTGDVAKMTPVFERAQIAEHQRKVYKWQGRAVWTLLGGAFTAVVTWFLKGGSAS